MPFLKSLLLVAGATLGGVTAAAPLEPFSIGSMSFVSNVAKLDHDPCLSS